MEIATLLIAIIALVIALLAYSRTGGTQDLRAQVGSLDSVMDALREKTANTLDRLGGAVRGSPETTPPLGTTPPAGETDDRQPANVTQQAKTETQQRTTETQPGRTEIRQEAAKTPQRGTRPRQRGTRTRQRKTKTQKR